jgi:hypothetical protein
MHAALQLARDEVQYTSSLLDTCRAELAADFQDWAAATYGPGAAAVSLQSVH